MFQYEMRNKAFKEPSTIQEKRAVKFLVTLNRLGYGYTISIPVFELTKKLKDKGVKISHPTLMGYWRSLERLGYVSREMQARIWGVTYKVKRYPIQQLTAKVIQ